MTNKKPSVSFNINDKDISKNIPKYAVKAYKKAMSNYVTVEGLIKHLQSIEDKSLIVSYETEGYYYPLTKDCLESQKETLNDSFGEEDEHRIFNLAYFIDTVRIF